jgi:hypothetical protein
MSKEELKKYPKLVFLSQATLLGKNYFVYKDKGTGELGFFSKEKDNDGKEAYILRHCVYSSKG